MPSLNITLQGHSSIHQYPERAMIQITVESSGECEVATSNEVATTCIELRDAPKILCPRNEDGTSTANSAVTTFSASNTHITLKGPDAHRPRGNPMDRYRMYNAMVTFQVIFRDFSELHKFIEKMDGYSNARLDNLKWYLTDETKNAIGAELRKMAVQNAVAKANQYAQAIDSEDVTPVDSKEIEVGDIKFAESPERPIYRHSSGLNLTPQDIVLDSCVERLILRYLGFGV
ncbi:unnamed protein product [Penicillium glandicola]